MLLSAPAQGKDSSPIHGSSTRRGRHRCGHDGQRKCVAHMPTAATTTEDSRSKFGRKLPTRLHDEAEKRMAAPTLLVSYRFGCSVFRTGRRLRLDSESALIVLRKLDCFEILVQR